MFRRILISILSIALALLVLAFFFVPPQIIEITEDQLAQGLEDNLPYRVEKGATVTVQSAQVQLSDDNKIIVTAQFDATGFTLEGSGTATVNSAIRYKKGKFYLSDLRHDDIKFEFSENSNDTISEVTSALKGILQRETEEAAASDDEKRIEGLANANEYVETKLKNDAIEHLDNALSSFPVYDLNRASGVTKIAALALDDVTITADKVLVTLSLQRLILGIAAIVGTFLFFAIPLFGSIFLAAIDIFIKMRAGGRDKDDF